MGKQASVWQWVAVLAHDGVGHHGRVGALVQVRGARGDQRDPGQNQDGADDCVREAPGHAALVGLDVVEAVDVLPVKVLRKK